MELKKCTRCGKSLNKYNPSDSLCFACQEKMADDRISLDSDSPYFEVEDVKTILGLKSTEQVRRLNRAGKLPPVVPAVKKLLWSKNLFMKWIHGGGRLPLTDRKRLDAVVEALGGFHHNKSTGEELLGDEFQIPIISAARNEKGKLKTGNELITIIKPAKTPPQGT